MKNFLKSICVAAFVSTGIAAADSDRSLIQDVMMAERAFAKSMADRNLSAFETFIDDEAIFIAGDGVASRGRAAVVAQWAQFFEGDEAPFSWEPEIVEVLDSGYLALSTGPVRGPDGQILAYYQSTWRKNQAGQWKVVFDRGQRYCPPQQ